MSARHPISGKGIVFSSFLLLFPAGLCCTEQVACSRAAACGTQSAPELLQSPEEHKVHIVCTSMFGLDDFCKNNIRCAACFLPELSLPMSCPSGGAVFCSLVFRIWNTWCSVSFMVCFFPLFWRISGTSEHGLCEGKGLICRRRTSEDQDGKHLSQSERLQWERTAELCAPWWPAYW